MIRLFLIFVCTFLFLSCRKEAKVKLPETKSLPVIYSYICPDDSVIRLKLFASSPLYSSNQIDVLASVPDANVQISSLQGTAQLVFNPATEYYELKTNIYPVLAGQTYKMVITTIDNKVATAETQVPITSVPINAVAVETTPENYQTSDRIKVSFTDEYQRVNYYRIAALHVFFDSSHTDTIRKDTKINELYSDANHDSENASLAGKFYQRHDSTAFYLAEYYDVYLFNCSQPYYNFYKSLKNYAGDNPFAEPALIYSNVQGGFGCFGAYTRSRLRYKVK